MILLEVAMALEQAVRRQAFLMAEERGLILFHRIRVLTTDQVYHSILNGNGLYVIQVNRRIPF